MPESPELGATLGYAARHAPELVGLLVKPGKGKLGRAKMLLVVLVLMGPREGLDLGPGSVGPAIDHEGLDRGLDWDMGLERKSMLHMELLQPPMLLFTTRMLPLPNRKERAELRSRQERALSSHGYRYQT